MVISCQHNPTDDKDKTDNTGSLTTSTNTDTEIDKNSSVEVCGNHLTMGNPAQSDQLLCREGYAVGYNYQTKVANWVLYYITSTSVQAKTTRVNNFLEDKDIPASLRATRADYSGSGYDRGHLAPNATMDFNKTSMSESFLLSNIAPQLPNFNRKGWADLEQYVRDCAVEKGALYVVTGPIYTSTDYTKISNVAIPDAYYKVLLDPSNNASGFAFKIPHQAIDKADLADYVTSIDAVESATGLDFYSAFVDTTENAIEASTTPICSLPWESTNINDTTSQYTCGSKTTCSAMTSCDEAIYYLNSCGVNSLDGDKNGIPCESICN